MLIRYHWSLGTGRLYAHGHRPADSTALHTHSPRLASQQTLGSSNSLNQTHGGDSVADEDLSLDTGGCMEPNKKHSDEPGDLVLLETGNEDTGRPAGYGSAQSTDSGSDWDCSSDSEVTGLVSNTDSSESEEESE